MRIAYRLPVRGLTASYACLGLGHGKRVLRTSRSIWISKHLGLLASAYALTHHRGYAIWVAFCLRASYRHVHVVGSHICFLPGIGHVNVVHSHITATCGLSVRPPPITTGATCFDMCILCDHTSQSTVCFVVCLFCAHITGGFVPGISATCGAIKHYNPRLPGTLLLGP